MKVKVESLTDQSNCNHPSTTRFWLEFKGSQEHSTMARRLPYGSLAVAGRRLHTAAMIAAAIIAAAMIVDSMIAATMICAALIAAAMKNDAVIAAA
jgi:hypothetical protein